MTRSDQHTPALSFRRGTPADSYTAFCVLEESLADLNRRLGSTEPTSWQDPAALARMWEERRSLYEHLAHTADQFWLAEAGDRAVGYARSIVRAGVRELTELFVVPGEQSAGAGRELLARAFPPGGSERRVVIASPDIRAQVLYLKSGVYPRFTMFYFGRVPEAVAVATDLAFEPIAPTPENVAILADIDAALIGHRRDADHAWLLSDRQGYLYRRDGAPVGYGYVGARSGPIALLQPADATAVLAHAETQSARAGRDHFGLDVPAINQAAVDHLLARGFRVDVFVAQFMSDAPFGRFENYIGTSPPFIL